MLHRLQVFNQPSLQKVGMRSGVGLRNVHLTGIAKVVPLLTVCAMSSPKPFTRKCIFAVPVDP
jgi:hypothetical protein